MNGATKPCVDRSGQPFEPPRAGFTLVELLVVVAIIGVLAGLLLTALSKAKANALEAECKGNLRDIGLATRMYVDEFEYYPTSNGTAIVGYDAWGMLVMSDWKESLLPYLGPAVVEGNFLGKPAALRKLRCPQPATEPDRSRRRGQYALNARGTAPLRSGVDLGIGGYQDGNQFRPTAETRVLAPADVIAAGDVAPEPSSSVFDVCATNRAQRPNASHNSQANMLFCDGHVESGRQTNWVSASPAARARWNNDHEPHPETWARP